LPSCICALNLVFMYMYAQEAACEWLKLPPGKKVLKRDARKILKESELDGVETISNKEVSTICVYA
jgi:hypothetical protein